MISTGITLLIALAVFIVSTFAWFALQTAIMGYAPITKPEALDIGAGHRNFDTVNSVFTDDHFENIRYLYFNGIDVNAGHDYYDYVFCVFGSVVSGYRLQLAYTTNNQFSYEIFRASESSSYSAGAVEYTTHTESPQTYYYTPEGVSPTPLAGSFLNARVDGGHHLIILLCLPNIAGD